MFRSHQIMKIISTFAAGTDKTFTLKYAGIILISTILFLSACRQKETPVPHAGTVTQPPEKIMKFGYDTAGFNLIQDTIRNGETLGVLLDRHHIPPGRLYDIVMQIKDTFDVKRIRAGKPYTVFTSKDSLRIARIFVYEPDRTQYIVLDMRDSLVKVRYEKKPITRRLKTASGIITSSLFQTLAEQGLDEVLALDLADIYAWTVDFYHIYRNDKFKVIYDELYVDDSIPIGTGTVHAAYFEHFKKPFYAFRFVVDSTSGIPAYFDEKSRNLQKAFLKSPIKFGRITSRYNKRRYLRLYGRVKPHLGTDFAAPIGTPIMSTANGVVIASTYKRGNGNYVKIKHNATYTTQYLHMSKRAVKVGDIVKQGQVIGYIGMTGSTTGPHVCYRFWKNGKQVDALREKLPDAKPMPDSIKTRYFEYIKPWKRKLDSIMYPSMRRDTVRSALPAHPTELP